MPKKSVKKIKKSNKSNKRNKKSLKYKLSKNYPTNNFQKESGVSPPVSHTLLSLLTTTNPTRTGWSWCPPNT